MCRSAHDALMICLLHYTCDICYVSDLICKEVESLTNLWQFSWLELQMLQQQIILEVMSSVTDIELCSKNAFRNEQPGDSLHTLQQTVYVIFL